jgi:hypothetical protein
MTKLRVAFRNFSNTPNKAFILAYCGSRNVDGGMNTLEASSSISSVVLHYEPSSSLRKQIQNACC